MTRNLLAYAAGAATLLAGSAAAFDRWCPCPPPRYYYCPPVVYGPSIWGAPAVVPPEMPAPVVKDKVVPPKPMAEPEPLKKDDKAKGGVTPAEFRDVPKSSELATPRPAPPPVVERRVDETAPAPRSAPAPMPPKTVDVPLPTTAPAIPVDPPKLTIPDLTATEPGKIPPLSVPSLPADAPKVPEQKPLIPATGGLQIPPIDIPMPSAPTTADKKSTSKASPLAAETRTVTVLPVAGSPPTSGRYTVRFVNKTDAAFELTVANGSVTLPGKHFVDVQIDRTFNWKLGDEPGRKAEIPADAAGLEVVVKPAR